MIKLKNIGNGTATTITYVQKCEHTQGFQADYPPINAIMNGDTYYVLLLCRNNDVMPSKADAVLVFQYDDLLGFSYKQKVILHFEGNTLLWCENDTPQYIGLTSYSVN